MRSLPLLLTLLCAVVALGAAGCGDGTLTRDGGRASRAASATCADYATQEQAQRAADTADPDGDGRYCESLPNAAASGGAASGDAAGGKTSRASAQTCRRTARVVDVGISATRYPAVVAHIDAAVRDGWPQVLRIRREGAGQRRARLLQGMPTRAGYDRDEWPMAMARSSWRAHVAYVPSGQNRGAGSSIALKLRRWCDGVRFRVVAY